MTAPLRLKPARVLPFHGDRLAADVARACLDEYAAYIAGEGGRHEALDRMATLTDYGAQRAALEVLSMTGWTVPRWDPAANRTRVRALLAAALADNETTVSRSALDLIMAESRRPFTRYEQERSTGR